MALFDAQQFDPQAYAGGLQGLLSRLLPQASLSTAPVQNPPGSELPSSYQRIGNQSFPVFGEPDPAQLPPNAAPVQGQLPPGVSVPGQPQQQQPGFGDSLSGALGGFSNGIQTGLLSAIRGGIEGARSGMAPQNQTVQALVARGLDPAIAQQVARDPATLRSILPSLIGGGQTDDIKEYQFAKREDPSLTFERFMAKKRATSGEFGMTPIYGVDKDGNPTIIQLGKSGQAVQAGLPDGVKLARDPIKVEGPTGTVILDPQTRQQVGFIPKDVAGAAVQKAQGEAQGAAVVSLPNAINKAETAVKLIDDLIKHPGRGTATGLSSQLDPRNYMAGTDATNFNIASKQLQGKAFLEAFESLKGGGAISEREGDAATAAVAKLSTSQSDDEYIKSLNDLKAILARGVEVARRKAAGNFSGDNLPSMAPAASQTSPASIDDLVKKYSR